MNDVGPDIMQNLHYRSRGISRTILITELIEPFDEEMIVRAGGRSRHVGISVNHNHFVPGITESPTKIKNISTHAAIA